IELHVEGSRTQSSDGDNFCFEYSTDGVTFTSAALPDLPFSDNGSDVQSLLPATLTGNVTLRVVDTNHAPGSQFLDTVSIDEPWIGTVPGSLAPIPPAGPPRPNRGIVGVAPGEVEPWTSTRTRAWPRSAPTGFSTPSRRRPSTTSRCWPRRSARRR